LNNPLKYVDPSGHNTVAIGLSTLLGCVFATDISIMYVVDDKGNLGIMTSPGGGGIAGLTISGSIGYQWTNADTIFDLAGPQIQVGVSIDPGIVMGVSAGAEYIIALDIEDKYNEKSVLYQGVNMNLGVAAGLPFEGHLVITNSVIEGKGNDIPCIPVKIPGLSLFLPLELSYENLTLPFSGIIDQIQNNPPKIEIPDIDPWMLPYWALMNMR
jgi:hypothetical protein